MNKIKLTRKQKKIQKLHNKTALLFGVAPLVAPCPLTEGDCPDEIESLYTIVPSYDEALEFVKKHIILRNKAHFESWCDLRNRNPLTEEAKQAYIDTVIDMNDPKNQYSIIDIKYTYEDLATILRISAGCAPIGCSFDNEAEIEAFLTRQAFLNKQDKKKKAAAKAKETKEAKQAKAEDAPRKTATPKRRGRPASKAKE